MKEKELLKLIEASKLYYEDNLTQKEIATILKTSRPSVSNLLNKARKEGIVKINVLSYRDTRLGLAQEISRHYHLKSCTIIKQGEDSFSEADKSLIPFLKKSRILGIGWDYHIYNMLRGFKEPSDLDVTNGIVCPLIGAASISHPGYHPNELVTMISNKTNFAAEYLMTPAFPISDQERSLFMDTHNYQLIKERWRKMDTALVSLGIYPTVPDHGTAMRFGKKLVNEKASGNILSYFFTREGACIESEEDYVIQIPLAYLKRIPHVMGLAIENENPRSVISCLNSGCIDHLIIGDKLAAEIIE